MDLCLKPIGFVRHGYSDEEIAAKHKRVEGYVEVLPEYAEGLEGLKGFSHVILVAYLHKVDSRRLKVKPMWLVRMGVPPEEVPELGVFATRSPVRPNPIAVTVVELVDIEEGRLRVKGLDLYDGTPILDIKPYSLQDRVEEFRRPEWLEKLGAMREKLGKSLGQDPSQDSLPFFSS